MGAELGPAPTAIARTSARRPGSSIARSPPTFVEDKDMVEAQQARLDERGEQGLVNIVSDTNRVVMRRFIERLLAEEEGALAAE